MSFSGEVQPIFNAACTGCHGGASPLAGLDLSAGKSWAALVGVPSTECAQTKLVAALSASTSYLVHKVEGPGPYCFLGSRMPLGGPNLSQAQVDTIRAWIDEGAPNN